MPTSYRILRYHDGATGRPQTKAGHTWVHSAGNAYPTPSRDPPTRRVDFIVNTSPAPIVTRTTVGHRQLRLHTKQEVHGWLNENPRIRAHFTPTSCIVDRGSWIVDEHSSDLVRHHRTPSHPPRRLRRRARTHHRDPHLHHRLAATIEPTPSSGPKTPRKSSRKPTVAKLQTGTTTVDRNGEVSFNIRVYGQYSRRRKSSSCARRYRAARAEPNRLQ
jgi:hypothetical protein